MKKDAINRAVSIDNHENTVKNISGDFADYRCLLYELFYTYYEEHEAQELYKNILVHKNNLEKLLNKKTSFLVAALYYNEEHGLFVEPRVVEKKLVEQLSEIAIYDSLTGLYKRAVFDSLLAKEIKKHIRHKEPLSLFMLDIDDFKVVNDTYGHQEGDKVLHEIGRLMTENSRLYDIECRYGGEELITILPATNENQAYKIAERLRKDILEYFASQPYKVTVSVGIAELKMEDDLTGFVHKVDQALYEAKESGKNQCKIFED